MAKALLEWETLDADQLNDIMEGKPPREPKPKQSGATPPPPPPPPQKDGTAGVVAPAATLRVGR